MKLLVADDEKNIRAVLRTELSAAGMEVEEAESGTRAVELLEREDFDILLLDLNMPGLGGIEVLKRVKAMELPTEVIILTAHATITNAVEAMKYGAYDYVTKPFKLEELTTIIAKAYEKKSLRSENLMLKTRMKREEEGRPFIAKSSIMLGLLDTLRKIAAAEFPVLINGESGTGKELIARLIHRDSNRSGGPFVAINCGAIPETMIESELFGYEKGAFTGAVSRKPGLLEIANEGTLFLDEIGDMPLPLQVKLLRVIETGSFFRLGGTREQKVNVRLVSATNKDLRSAIDKGTFRQDLFFRITTLSVVIPPLRERREDIEPLIEHFMKDLHGYRLKKLSAQALAMLSDYAWPGNVRELQNVIQRAMLLSRTDTIECDDLPSDLHGGREETGRRLEDIERVYILRILKEVGGQRGKAADILGINPKTLYRKLQEYGVQD